MSKKTQDRVINGEKFIVGQQPAIRSVLLLRRLLAAIAPAVAKGLEGAVSNPQSMVDLKLQLANLDVSVLGASLGGATDLLFKNLGEQELRELIHELLSTALVQRGETFVEVNSIVDELELMSLFGAVKFALEVNYKSFFSDLLRSIQEVIQKKRAEKKSATSTTSAGQPNG